jgi:CRISPR-associated endonuclease/helicase Cas3
VQHNAITGNNDEEYEIEGTYLYQSLDNGLSPVVENLFTKKDLSLITVPVAVMTIDHIMSAITASRGAYVKSALRIATSDLLIDEVDSFSAQDCHAISKLCYLTGLFGKRVVIASATLPPELSSMMFDAYQAGYNEYSKSFGGNLYAGAFSNSVNPNVKHVESGFESLAFFNDYTKSIQHNLVAKEHRNKIAILNLPTCPKNDLSPIFSAVLDHAISQANAHHTNIPPKSFSSGFVRFNFIKDAQKLFLYIIENADRIRKETGWAIRVNFYSGKMDFTSRKTLEQRLSKIMNRKNSEWMFEPEIQNIADKTLFLLISTPVIEVGRDYDFDFALLEPSSYMSLIQSAGRVLRHRRDRFEINPNVFVMSDSIRSLTSDLAENKCRFGANGPGFQQHRPDGRGLNISNRDISNNATSELFGLGLLDKGIHAGYRLHSSGVEISSDRADKDMIKLFHSGYDLSIASYIENENSLIAKEFDSVMFRANDYDKDDELFCVDKGGMVSCFDKSVSLPYSVKQLKEEHCFIKLSLSKTKIEMSKTISDIMFSPYLGVLC